MAAKENEASKVKDKPVEVAQAEPEVVQPVVAQQPEKPKSNQTALTIAIISAVALFFVGLGLGYLLGHTSTSGRNVPGNGTMQPPSDGGGRRFYPNSGTNDDTNTDTNSDTKTQTN